MMYWAVGICCYAYKQYVATGAVADSMFVSVKFFFAPFLKKCSYV